MSFKCDFCSTTAPNGTKARMVPSEVRVRSYRDGSSGQEVVKEKRCCEACWLAGVEAPAIIHMPPSMMMSYQTLEVAKNWRS